MPFTDKQIAALKAKSGRYEKAEPGRTGLRIRVMPSGQKVWSFVYRIDGAQKRMELGRLPKVGLSKARKALADAKDKLREGIDPGAIVAEEKRAERDAETVELLVQEYIARRPSHKAVRPRTIEHETWMLNREIIPEWGKRKAKSITRRDVIQLLDDIEDRPAPVLRNHVAALISKLFIFGMDRGILDSSPGVGIRRLQERSRDRFLSVEEIRSFWHGLDKADITPAVRLALRFILVTGQRRIEVAGAMRSEIDDTEKLWHLPASRAKNGRANVIPLPPLALWLLGDADRLRVRPKPVRPDRKGHPPYDATPSPWLLPSWRLGRALSAAALTRAVNRNREVLGIGDATVHDIRRTFATYLGELGTAPEILSALLNHVPVSITGAVYNRASNIEPRRRAMGAWCSWLERVIAGEHVAENVIRLQRRSLKPVDTSSAA